MDYSALSGSELVRVFNAMAQQLGVRQVRRFANLKVGRKRCQSLETELKAKTKQPDILDEFKTNNNKFRGRLLVVLAANMGHPMSIHELARVVYGKQNKVGALKMVMRGIELTINKRRLAYRLIKTNENGVLCYGIAKT